MERLYAYIVARDDGFAPNPFHGFCTLACCMPVTRRVAQKCDYVVGLAGTRLRPGGDWRIIYAMQVTDKMTFGQYWLDPCFFAKRPDMSAGGKKALGDNIYRWDDEQKEYRQAPSRHSNADGTENLKKKHHDTKKNDCCVLISSKFAYWGGKGPALPDNLRFLKSAFERSDRNHRRNFSREEVEAFIEWFADQEKGCLGEPTNGLPSPR